MLQEKWVHTQGGKFWRKIPHIYCEVTHHCEFSPTAMGIVVQLGLKLNTKLGLDHPPPTPTNFSKCSRLGNRLRFDM